MTVTEYKILLLELFQMDWTRPRKPAELPDWCVITYPYKARGEKFSQMHIDYKWSDGSTPTSRMTIVFSDSFIQELSERMREALDKVTAFNEERNAKVGTYILVDYETKPESRAT